MKRYLRVGLIVNPLAGIGGAVGLKGSDGSDIVREALARGAKPRASERTLATLERLADISDHLEFFCFPGVMGEDVCRLANIEPVVVGELTVGKDGSDRGATYTSAHDTESAAKALRDLNVDIIVFAGGDGTARNIYHAIGSSVPVLGIPAGVKIHSGVYAVNGDGAANILKMLVEGDMVSITAGEVRDIDEDAFRRGVVKAKYYGELLVPNEDRYLQQVKCGGKPVEALVLQDIAEHVIENMEDDIAYIFGPGSTTGAIVEQLGLNNTLLGVDVVKGGELIASDANESVLIEIAKDNDCQIVITPIGGQGHIIGRGNHQIGPEVIRLVGKEKVIVVSTPSKIEELCNRPLLVDSYDKQLNLLMKGLITVVTGFESTILYRVE
ncbi:ATP-NAD kinase [Gammaproteobacteria bacterium 45_16_T64]|nr:ATP-NAD kinase [Gammaproteobacteria bacterium 45_16_T64]